MNGSHYKIGIMCTVIQLIICVLLATMHLKQLTISWHAFIQDASEFGKNYMNCHQIQNTVSNVFYEMIAQGHQAPTHLNFHHLPHNLHTLYSAQEQLGWKQLYYGHLIWLWSALLQQYHPQINSIIYLANIIKLTWQAMLKVWKLHHDHLHPGNLEQEDHSHLQAAVNQIFFEA